MGKVKNFNRLQKINLILIILLAVFVFTSRNFDHKQTKDVKSSVDSLKIEVMDLREDIEAKDSLIINGLDSLLNDINSITAEYKSKQKFYDAVGHKESRGNYTVVNAYGYLGKYQFSIKTIHGLGIDVTAEEYLNNPLLQEKTMRKYVAHNKWTLRKYISQYRNTLITYTNDEGELDKFYVTTSGIVAAAHLSGAGNVMKFFNSNGKIVKQDAFGTSVIDYMKKFSGYHV